MDSKWELFNTQEEDIGKQTVFSNTYKMKIKNGFLVKEITFIKNNETEEITHSTQSLVHIITVENKQEV